jgi:5-methylcytosine-specific restriction enzyme A
MVIRRKVPKHKKFYYTIKWRKTRARILKRDPVCMVCKERPSSQVDHKIKAIDKPELRFADFNLRGLCQFCHSQKTIADQKNIPVKPPRRGSDETGMPTDPTHPWFKEKK